jgi:hypothetical protein
VRRADNLATFMCRLSRNSESLELLELSGPVQACNGMALPLFTERRVLLNFVVKKYDVTT